MITESFATISPSLARPILSQTRVGMLERAPRKSSSRLLTGRPVRLVNNRLEDFLGARSSIPTRVWLKMGLAKDGEIVAKDSVIIADNGAYSGLAPEMVLVTAFRTDCLHRLQNVRSHARLVFTNKLPSGTFRA